MLHIDGFPHAYYNSDLRLGWLCHYYKCGTLTDKLWREQTYTPELLNYKEGKLQDIEYFVEPYLTLLEHVISKHNASYACLLPIPPSIPVTSRMYTRHPRSKTGKNRDNRNDIFCQLLVQENDNLLLSDALTRIKKKPPRQHWTAEEHRSSMSFDDATANLSPEAIFVLVDDIYTLGGTLQGASLLLAEKFPQQQIISLPIARSIPSNAFKPLFAA